MESLVENGYVVNVVWGDYLFSDTEDVYEKFEDWGRLVNMTFAV